MAQRRPRPRPSTTAAKERERGGAVRPEPVFWGNGLRRVTLGKDYKAGRMIKAILVSLQRVLMSCRERADVSARLFVCSDVPADMIAFLSLLLGWRKGQRKG